MSFSDMMSSGRGPGVIGMILALVVLLGFGVLFMFAFDEGFQGPGKSIESVVKAQMKEIEDHHAAISAGEARLAKTPELAATAGSLSKVQLQIKTGVQKIASLKTSIAENKAAVEAKIKDLEEYKNRYRAFVRGNAKGQTLPTLQTVSGAVYKNVTIREVTAVGMQIRHDEGHKRINFEELPPEMRDYYQFDAKQRDKALADENVGRNQHEAEAAVADELADAQMAKQREANAGLAKEKMQREITQKEGQITALEAEIKNLQQASQRAAAEAAAARAAGHMHLNKVSGIEGSIRAKQNQIAALNNEIAALRARL